MSDYLPDADAAVRNWVRNFSTHIFATPGAYGLMESDASSIGAAVDLFDQALTLAVNPGTRTMGVVADKNAKKAAMLVTLRYYAQVIKHNLGISNEAKITLGLRINHAGRSPVPAPSTVPVLAVASDVPLAQRVEFRDSTTPSRRAKPPGVTGMMLAVAVAPPGATLPADPATVPVYGIATRQPYRVQFPSDAKGKTACYFGCWINGTGQVGPWSIMAQLMIAG